ncbi:ESPR-type extended signal peptide-containing protein [uncultured Mitsuokella sp.]|uniref:ESPR-type extended signal peptide-containing protein n=1 Tax=uncultured Mitsuokella sp. TaxID=453120 RepID=UPI00266F8565|nr:ESPR-type extended signal peptide-containing protein [uncultured Mitsuokella sp.]
MNRIYKVIFNRTKGQYEVVPEIAKNGGKAPKRSTGRHLHHSAGILPTAALLSSLLFSGGACAAATPTSTSIEAGDTISAGANISVTKDGKNITVNTKGVATEEELNQVKSTATDNTGKISTNEQNIATNTKNIADNKKAIEKNAKDIADNKTSIDKNSKAINSNKSAIDKNKSDITANKTAIAKNQSDISTNKANIANNTSNITANRNSIAQNSSAIDELKKVNESLGLSKGNAGIKYFRANSSGTTDDAKATGADALAVGKSAAASKDKAIAIGVQADASGNGAIAIGGEIRTGTDTDKVRNKGAEAAADNSTAIGTNAEVVSAATNGIALGHGAITGARSGMKADDGTAILLVSGGKNSVSIGNNANARGNSAIALGDGAIVMNDASGSTDAEGRTISKNGIAIGTNSKTVSENAMAIGAGATVNNASTGAAAIGNDAHATKENALAIGTNATVDHANALAIGTNAQTTKDEAIAIGKDTQAAGDESIAMGSGTKAKVNNVVAIGHKAEANVVNSVVIGEEAGKGMMSYTTNVNGSHVMIGNKAGQNVDGQEDISVGFDAGSNVKGNHNIAIGSGAGTYIGDKTDASTEDSLDGKNISLGYMANHYGQSTSISEATALGANTIANTHSTAVGSEAKAQGKGATAIGFTSTADGEDSMAMGEGAIAHDVGNVAIGKGSLATAAMAKGTAYLTGTTATQVVSVGNKNTTDGLRRIVNVADGSDLQDAATVNQLQTLQQRLESQIASAPAGSSKGDAVTYSGDHNQYVRLEDKSKGAVQIKNVKDGTETTDAVNKGQMDTAVDNAKVHYYSVKTDNDGTHADNYNNDGAFGTNSLAMGIKATVTTDAERGVAVGNNVTTASTGGIAIGVGYKNDDGSMTETKAIGRTGENYQYNIAIGAGAQSAGDNSLAIGTRATTQQQNGTGPTDNNDAIAIGYLAETTNVRGVAMGAQAKSSGRSSNAIGNQANAEGENSIAIGTKSSSNSLNSIAIGNETSAADGTSDTVIGNKSKTSKAENANVFGTDSSIVSEQPDNDHVVRISESSMMGNHNQIVRNDANAITNVIISGNSNKVQGSTEKDPLDADKLDRINITGTNNEVTLKDNTLPVQDITIMGNDNHVVGSSELPMKGGSSLSNIQILGSKVTATVANSVYLGTGSVATASATGTTAGSSKYTGTYDRDAAGQTADGVVTVGSVGKERRIQNVAAGLVSTTSTDAVNGSQLFLRTQPLRFAGDNSTIGATSAADQNVLHRSSDQAMTIKGGINEDSKLSNGNIGVIADAANNIMTVKLANDVKVNSVTTGSTEMDTNGVTIKNADTNKNIIINDGNISFGGNQVKNMGSGSDGTDEKGNPTYNTLTNGANIGDIKNITDARRTIVKSSDQSVKVTSGKDAEHDVYDLSVDYGKAADAVDLKYTGDNNTKGQNKLKDSVAFNGTSNQIVTAAANGSVTFKLDDEVHIGSKDADGKVNVNDKGGITGVSIWANSNSQNGKTQGGHISLNGEKGANDTQGAFVDIWTEHGQNTLTPAQEGKKASRIVYKDAQGEHEVATMDDGQKYKGDFGIGDDDHAASVKLNKQVNIVGDISSYNEKHPDSKVDESALTKDTANVGVVTSTDKDGNATLAIRLNKDLHIDSTTMEKKDAQGNVINSNITNAEGSTITKKDAKGQNAASTTANAGSLTIQNGKTKTTIDKSGIATNHINVGEKTRIGDAAAKIGNVDIDGKKGQVKVGTNTTLNDGFAVIDGVKVGQHKANDTNLTIYNKDGKATTKKDTAGKYVTGLTNKTWNADNSYVSGRAATEDQLHQIVKDLIGPSSTGGFGLSANGGSVKKALGETIAINGDGTYDAAGKQTTAGNIITSVDGSAIKVALNRDLNIDSTTMEKTNNDGTKVSNVTNAEGSTMTKTDAQGNTSSTTVNAGSLTIKNGDVTTTIDKDGVKTNKVKVGENTTIDDGSATIGKVSINGNGEKDGATNKEHTSTITGLSNKEFDTNNLNKYKDSGRAATEAQLKVVYDKASQHTTVTVNGGSEADSSDGNIVLKKKDEAGKGSNYDLSLNDDIKLGKDKDGRLTVQSKDGSKSITTDGSTGTLTFKDGQKEVSVNAADAANGVDGTSIKRAAMDGHTIATLDDGMKYAGDTGDALKQKLNSTTNIKGGISDTTKLSDNNIGVVSDGKDTLTVKLAKDIKGLNSMEVTTVNAETVNADTFKAGNTTINNNGLTINTSDQSRAITIQDNHISMGGNQIHNVAPGTADDDAVNVSQLKKLGGEVSNVSNRVNRVGAGAAALAALHPQDFDPDDKWDFAVGYGNYRGANAAAVGAFYQPNEDTTFSVGGTVGGGENMVNVGVSWKFGQGSHVTNSRVAMAKDMLAMKQQIAYLTQKLAAYEAADQPAAKALPASGTMTFPDVPENHWAYQYVKYLAEHGYLQGYPDGEFKGDRAMTRYEYAAIIYRALQNGAPSDGNMVRSVDEFGPELTKVQNIDRFRVDRISGKDNDRHKIERVHVNSQDNKEKNDYRDVYGSRIAQ